MWGSLRLARIIVHVLHMYFSFDHHTVISDTDSIRTMLKYANDPVASHGITLDAKLDRLFKECRGQRNFYITGFALFLIL
jgi:hypothetical protein